MKQDKNVWPRTIAFAAISLLCVCAAPAQAIGAPLGVASQSNSTNEEMDDCEQSGVGSPYIPVDSWIYPAVLRLYSFGVLDNVNLNMRPWTRASVSHMLEDAEDNIEDLEGEPIADEARKLYEVLDKELSNSSDYCYGGRIHLESTYTLVRGISGTPLNDSYHLGSSLINDYGRPYANGINNYSGASGYATAGRFTLFLRGEFQRAPSTIGYSAALAQALATLDQTVDPVTQLAYPNQTTIPAGSIGAASRGRFLEAYVSAHVLNHVISFGKVDQWLGPAQGGSFAYSNNAENIYAFQINRIEPLDIPLLSRITGPFRYEFLIGSLRGHELMPNPLYNNNPASQPNVISPGNPWVHVEKISFRPTANLEFGFERTSLLGGKGHSPVTLHTFLKSFFSLSAPQADVKGSRDDPGARFGAFDFSYRLPFVRNWLTLYADSEVHDDVSPIDAPRRSAYRPGIYLSHVPGFPKLDLRVEAASTDPSATWSSQYGHFMYWESIERQGYTNQGHLFGDWIGREDKGGQAWLTYYLSGNEWIQVGVRNQKATKDFIPGSTTQTFSSSLCPIGSCLVPGGTTLNDINIQVIKRIGGNVEINGNLMVERWKAPIYMPGPQTVTAATIKVTWYPRREIKF